MFITSPKWKQSKYLSTNDEWIKKCSMSIQGNVIGNQMNITNNEHFFFSSCFCLAQINSNSLKKEWSTVTCYDMDEPLKYYSKWNNSVTKDHIL